MKQDSLMIKKYLKKKKEKVIIDLVVNNYNQRTFYVALIFNMNINMYKVLYIPMDIINDNDIENYTCYQFIDLMSVDYILRMLDSVKNYDGDFNRVCSKVKSFGIEINIDLLDKNYKFETTQYIPKDWGFLFDVVVTLFSYVPHIVSGIVEDMLTLFKSNEEEIFYQELFEFNLPRDDSAKLKKTLGGKLLDFDQITYLEEVNGKYFSIISGYIVIIEYNSFGIVKTYCECDKYYDYVYTVIEAIREEIEKKFYRLLVFNKENRELGQYYLCYGFSDDGLKVIHGCKEKKLPYSLYKEGLIEIIYDKDKLLEKEIKNKIDQLYKVKLCYFSTLC